MVVGAQRPQRQVGLGGQDEHEQCVAEGNVPAEEAQPDGHRDQRHRDRGQQLKNEGGQEGQAQGGERGGAVAVGHVGDRTGLGLGAPEDLEGRQPGHDVEEVTGQLLEGPHAGQRPVPRAWPRPVP